MDLKTLMRVRNVALQSQQCLLLGNDPIKQRQPQNVSTHIDKDLERLDTVLHVRVEAGVVAHHRVLPLPVTLPAQRRCLFVCYNIKEDTRDAIINKHGFIFHL